MRQENVSISIIYNVAPNKQYLMDIKSPTSTNSGMFIGVEVGAFRNIVSIVLRKNS